MDGDRATEDRRVALFAPSFVTGGIERVTLNLVKGFDRAGYDVDLLLGIKTGRLLSEVPDSVEVIGLSRELPGFSVFPYAVPGAISYLRRRPPDAVIAGPINCNLTLLLAAELTRFDGKTVVVEHLHPGNPSTRDRLGFPLAHQLYPRADAVVTVSDGVADGCAEVLNLPRDLFTTIYNPVVTPELHERKTEPVDHEWFHDDRPVITSLGRMADQKDYPTLLRAFKQLPEDLGARLFMMGSGPRNDDLRRLAERLGLTDDVEFAGYVDNPHKYIHAGDVFALSSEREGLPTVLIEALACGSPIVATDCPSGPREILQDGAYGRLVPVGDDVALSEALAATIRDPPDRDRQIRRSEAFSVEAAVEQYRALIE